MLLADADIMRVLTPKEINDAFDLKIQLRHVNEIFDRAFNSERVGWAPTRSKQTMLARVFVTLKPSVFDPQGRTIADALQSLGYQSVQDVRQGKYFELDLGSTSGEEARRLASEVADKLLANPVIESYRVEVADQADR